MLYLLLLYDLNMILLCVQTTIGNAGKTYAGRSEKGLPAAAACRPQHIYMVIELQHLRFVISCCPLCLRSQRRSTSLLSSFRPLSAVFGTSLLAVCNACCIQCAADDVISGTGQILNSSASDQNNTVLLQIVPFAGDVGCNFDSIGKTYSGDLTKSRIRLLRCSRLDCCADTALLRSTDSDGTLAQGVEASLQCRRCGLLDRCLTTLSNELVKCWHSISPPCKILCCTGLCSCFLSSTPPLQKPKKHFRIPAAKKAHGKGVAGATPLNYTQVYKACQQIFLQLFSFIFFRNYYSSVMTSSSSASDSASISAVSIASSAISSSSSSRSLASGSSRSSSSCLSSSSAL